ncbi:MspA family porin [Nocardia sp. NPDC055002]
MNTMISTPRGPRMNAPYRARTFRAAGFGAGAVAACLLSTGTASADQFIELPAVSATEPLLGGGEVTVTGDDFATVSPSVGATPLHRNVWVSGNVQVNASGMTNGRLEVGYIIGCQVAFGAGADVDGGAEPKDGEVAVQASAGAEMTLGPGEVKRYSILQIKQKDEQGDSETVGYYTFDGDSASFTYSDKTFGLTGCAGAAQARMYVNLTAYQKDKGTKSKITVYGQPFGI